MAKYKYSFKKFFTTVPFTYVIADSKFVTNGYFVVKRDYLRKPQNDFIKTDTKIFNSGKHTEEYIEKVYEVFKQAQETAKQEDSTEFIPVYLGTECDKNTTKPYKVVMAKDYKCIKEEYYNFFKDIKGEIFYHPTLQKHIPLPVYRNNEMIGLIFPVIPHKSLHDNTKYKEVI